MDEWSDYEDKFGGRGKTLQGGTETRRTQGVGERATKKSERKSGSADPTPERYKDRGASESIDPARRATLEGSSYDSGPPRDLAERSTVDRSSGGEGGGKIFKSIQNIAIVTIVVLGLVFGAVAYYDLDSNESLVGAVLNETETTSRTPSAAPDTVEPTAAPATPTTDPTPTAPATASPEPVLDVKRVENLVHVEINERRATHDLSTLNHDPRLRTIARKHSAVMAEHSDIFHVQPDGDDLQDRYSQAGYSCRVSTGEDTYTTGGENVAQTWYQQEILSDRGTLYYDSPRELAVGIVNQWMNSTGHRENILRPYWNNEGIGIVIIEQGGEAAVYATQVFC